MNTNKAKAILILSLVTPLANASYAESLKCMSDNLYHEGRGESSLGRKMIMDVVMNRVNSPKFPNTICKVIHQKSQFSWTNDSLSDEPSDKGVYKKLRNEAHKFLRDRAYGISNNSLFYHSFSVSPKWAKAMRMERIIGNHIFYKEA